MFSFGIFGMVKIRYLNRVFIGRRVVYSRAKQILQFELREEAYEYNSRDKLLQIIAVDVVAVCVGGEMS